MIRRFASNLMIVFGCMAFAVVGLGPRGAAICIASSHSLGEVIVAACEGGGHSHEDVCHHHPQVGGSDDDEIPSGVPHQHQHSPHGEPHAPCADIPLDQDEYRASDSTAASISGKELPVAVSPPMAVSNRESFEVSAVPRPEHRRTQSLIARDQTACSLRAVVLQI